MDSFYKPPPFPGRLKPKDKGPGVYLLQEVLNAAGYHVPLTGEFGPATEAALAYARQPVPLQEKTWQELVALFAGYFLFLLRQNITPAARVRLALTHTARIPFREIGGDNKGPFVRLVTGGKEVPWCCYLVTGVLHHAGYSQIPVLGYVPDFLEFAQERGLIVPAPQQGDVFFVGKTHVGYVLQAFPGAVLTIEGNTDPRVLGTGRGWSVTRLFRETAGLTFARPDLLL